MGTSKSNTLIMASLDDLKALVDEEIGNAKLQAFVRRFENVLIGRAELANMHSVSPVTVTNYIKDGLIIPEAKVNEKDHPMFRLSYALTLDFKELQKELRAKNKGWYWYEKK